MKLQTILIEGIDGSGKSTLAKELRNRLGWDSQTLNHQSGDQFNRYLSAYSAAHHTVLERGHISEIAYSQLFQRDIPFSDKERAILDRITRERMVLILADPDTNVAQHRVTKREHVHQVVTATDIEHGKQVFRDAIVEGYMGASLIIYKSRDFEEMESVIETVMQLVKEQS